MTTRLPARDALRRYGLAAVALCYVLALAILPAHGHGLELLYERTHHEMPDPTGPDEYLDCFFCQVLTTAAHPAAAPKVATGCPLASADAPQAVPHLEGTLSPRFHARAPPAR